MPVNSKKPITFLNPTKYFEPSKDKVRVTVSSPASWRSKCCKTDGYEARLYWHYKYIESVDGQVFYYTLTYNDASIPKYFGMNVFDYEDLRDLLTGGFRKRLLREYGSIFKYFIGAELGDGKGERGMHNNPHYHVLFFVEPDPKCQFPYVKITPDDFRHLIKMYWQGFDETRDGFRDYRLAKFGIAREGRNCGLVDGFAACVYCAKYVTKDAALKMHEHKVSHFLRERARDSIRHDETFFRDFFHTVIYDRFNVPASADLSRWSLTDHELLIEHFPNYQWAVDLYGTTEVLARFYENASFDFIKKYDLQIEFREFRNQRLDEIVAVGLAEFRNRYCNKPRISHGVGDYALEELRSMQEPLLCVPDNKEGFKYRPLSLYYYRKLFTEVLSPIEPGCKVGEKPKRLPPIRILNDAGVNYRLKRLSKNVDRLTEKAISYARLICNDAALYDRMRESNVNTEVFLTFSHVQQLLKPLLYGQNGNSQTGQTGTFDRSAFHSYAIYKMVYENRYFPTGGDASFLAGSLRTLDFRSDYVRFITPSYFSVSRDDLRLRTFIQGDCMGYLPYSQHPYFLRYGCLFALLDLCADYFAIQADDSQEAAAKERARIKRYHDSRRLKEFYSAFQ